MSIGLVTYPSTSGTLISSNSGVYYTTNSSSTAVINSNPSIIINNTLTEIDIYRLFGVDTVNQRINAQNGWSIHTSDGTIIELDANGNIKILDDQAKIIYKSNRIREFNKYINASDLLEDFIRFAGEHGAKQNNVLTIPIEVFINWLIIEASKFDNEPTPDLPLVEKLQPVKPIYKCLCCGRFISKRKFNIAKFCDGNHYQQYLERSNA